MKKNTGFIRVIKAAGYSWKGLKAGWQHEAAIRQELLALVLAVIIAFSLSFSAIERILLVGSVVLVVVIELLNSAIEAVVDRIGTEYHVLSGRAKDMGSAAVLVTSLLGLFIWIMLFIGYFQRL
ncbi:MAG: diacylglycerol kinase [Morganella sp. (in: enterobacteria)]|uniref:Diacylglycerol kinase n=1 Tax=Morganella psychrotolerans TaxID=368603 RepID=A0A1B8HKB1_9GAMM|nr:diacylglycerol kinase [Morganella psychrotolerans]OBU09761.1 diacylglycerol kinase [Morganella psychrotolerans]OBU12144.1 diacylglycerol kinase [Morganella psychrotolerans]